MENPGANQKRLCLPGKSLSHDGVAMTYVRHPHTGGTVDKYPAIIRPKTGAFTPYNVDTTSRIDL